MVHLLALALVQPRGAHTISDHQLISSFAFLPSLQGLAWAALVTAIMQTMGMRDKSPVTCIRDWGTSGRGWGSAVT